MGGALKESFYPSLSAVSFVLVCRCPTNHCQQQSFNQWLQTAVLYLSYESALWGKAQRRPFMSDPHSISGAAHLRLEDSLLGWLARMAG